jgi:hypothetical protein
VIVYYLLACCAQSRPPRDLVKALQQMLIAWACRTM